MKASQRNLKTRLFSPLKYFINDSRSVGITLIVCTIISLVLSNSGFSAGYINFWEHEFTLPFQGVHLPNSMLLIINDVLMAFFFLLVGMEIKREVKSGELSNFKQASLPIFAAIGGVVVPAVIYILWNMNSGFSHGWGIPMATDIAFALGILSLLGKRAPLSLKVLLAALAIIDDLMAILVIAIFYTEEIKMVYLGMSGLFLGLLIILNVMKVHKLSLYFIAGIGLWYCMFNSGIHATLAGAMLALTIPLKNIPKLENQLHIPISFIILPLFALANTAILLPSEFNTALASPINHGILMGLVLGKPLGIVLFSFVMVKIGLASMPKGLNWKHIIGMGLIAGIGFTMSIFISMLAFTDPEAQIIAKISVLIASTIAAIIGYLYLYTLSKKENKSIMEATEIN